MELDDDCDHTLCLIKDDVLFQSCGLIVFASHTNKSVFITWNKYYLLNIRFKIPKDSLRVKMTVVRIPLPIMGGSYIRSVHTLKYNTILLMSDGGVYCFGSFKTLKLIKCLRGVRCLAVLQEGFSVIREDQERLLLQMYLDLPGLENGQCTLQYSFDITFEEKNIFPCEWQHDDYTLTTLKVSEAEQRFIQTLLGLKSVNLNYVHIFSISGHVFALTSRPESIYPEYHIELLCVYAAHVRFIRLLPIENLCLVFLSTGSVDMWYVSNLIAIKQRQIHHTGSEWLDYDATSDNGDFYYTDGQQLVRLRFKYNIQLDECSVHTFIQPVPGIQACAWVDHKNELVCLSDNNLFYGISFDLPKEKSAGRLLQILAADSKPGAIEQMRRSVKALRIYKLQPDYLQEKLQNEYEAQKLISVGKGIYLLSAAFKSTLEFHRHLPSDAVLLQPAQDLDLCTDCIYAVFNNTFIEGQPLLHSTHWKVLILYDNHAHVYMLPSELFVKKKNRTAVALKQMRNVPLPHFKIKLVCLIELHRQMCAVLFPISVERSRSTYRALFSGSLSSEKFLKYNQIQLYKVRCEPIIKQAMRVDLTLSLIKTLFHTARLNTHNTREIYFIDEGLQLLKNINAAKYETLQSKDASAIYCFKQHMILNAEILDIEPSLKSDNLNIEKIMKFQSKTELFYGSMCNDVLDCATNIVKYTAIRNYIF
ncbi:uncharacterized protein [Drosophila takahashii]|uniref:uncharacterized protein isoform X2 n=1 Tax=Drosophila takahashii TaxID=29030 RepID=UPI003898F514